MKYDTLAFNRRYRRILFKKIEIWFQPIDSDFTLYMFPTSVARDEMISILSWHLIYFFYRNHWNLDINKSNLEFLIHKIKNDNFSLNNCYGDFKNLKEFQSRKQKILGQPGIWKIPDTMNLFENKNLSSYIEKFTDFY